MLEEMKQFIQDEDGASAAEYAILVAFIAVAVAAAVQLFNLGNIFSLVSTKVQTIINNAG